MEESARKEVTILKSSIPISFALLQEEFPNAFICTRLPHSANETAGAFELAMSSGFKHIVLYDEQTGLFKFLQYIRQARDNNYTICVYKVLDSTAKHHRMNAIVSDEILRIAVREKVITKDEIRYMEVSMIKLSLIEEDKDLFLPRT